MSLLGPVPAVAQLQCGDLDGSGSVDAGDAAILRTHLTGTAPLGIETSLLCNVIDELSDPALNGDPKDLASPCSMADVAVMSRTGADLTPSAGPACALGSTEDCATAHPGVGCNEPFEVICVCASEPTCCTVEWDDVCVATAGQAACAEYCGNGVVETGEVCDDGNAESEDGCSATCQPEPIFVSALLGDDALGLGTRSSPLASVREAVRLSPLQGRPEIRVQAGDYDLFIIDSDLQIRGGFDSNWLEGPRSDPAHRSRITSAVASGIFIGSATAALSNLELVGVDWSDCGFSGSIMSNSVLDVHLGSELTVDHVTFVQGAGRRGCNGADGEEPFQAPFDTGQGFQGHFSEEQSLGDLDLCDTSAGPGGAGGQRSCPGTAGGRGGAGGSMDTRCGLFGICSDCNARPGSPGDDGEGALSIFFGRGGTGGATCSLTGGGAGGRGRNGPPGMGGLGGRPGGRLLFGRFGWAAFSGMDGTAGGPGRGGGGGGGSGGCDTGLDDRGAGGGGGGAGGCPSEVPGRGGFGAGGSFGIFAKNSTVTVTDSLFLRGAGGTGGNGGHAAAGQGGGPGGLGGNGFGDTGPGGEGGGGGDGACSGGGGGGGGGISFGIYTFGSDVTQSGNSFEGGVRGARGGRGAGVLGLCAGTEGAFGAVGEVGICFSDFDCFSITLP